MANYEFDYPMTGAHSIIKVIGVGGGGSNAVNYMYSQGIKDVDFFVCNTDAQALRISPVPNRIQIGTTLTSGLGCGANPEVGKNAALESKEEIKDMLAHNTRMVFITAGMGGGTGTGAAPVIAEVAKSMGILTVGIVTMPFGFEGKPKFKRAEEGIKELKAHCDTVLVILNDRLQDVFGKSSIKEAFGQADNVLTKAAKSIAEIITVEGQINVDFEDVRTVLKGSGVAVMGSSTAEGENRAIRAAEGAINSPLLNNKNIVGARYILLSIVVGDTNDFEMQELEDITNFVRDQAGEDAEVIFGLAEDPALNNSISVTIIATGFHEEGSLREEKEMIDLDSSRRFKKQVVVNKADFFDQEEDEAEEEEPQPVVKKAAPAKPKPDKIVFELEGDYEIIDEEAEEKKKRTVEEQYQQRKQQLSRLKSVADMSPDEVKELQDMPAYMRKGVRFTDTPRSDEPPVSRYRQNTDHDLLGNNRFLHDNVD